MHQIIDSGDFAIVFENQTLVECGVLLKMCSSIRFLKF